VNTGLHSNQIYADCVDLSAAENASKQKGQVSLSGTPCVSRRHAAGLTPTAEENTRVKWL
jgi:hypothetical protein